MTDLTPLRNFLSKLLASRGDHAPFSDQDSLIHAGRVDSVDVMEVAFFLEDQYGVDFSQRGIDPQDFDSIEKIRRLFIDCEL